MTFLVACGSKAGEPSRESGFLISWASQLGGAQRVFQAGQFVVGEWESFTPAPPAPPAVQTSSIDGQPGPKGYGWVLSAGRSANEVVLVREGDDALRYCVYRLAEPGGACRDLPGPDDSPWVFRAAECGSDTTKCLLVRWTKRAGATAVRIALTVVDADTLSAGITHIVEVEGGFYGTADTENVALNPSQSTAYLLEGASKDDATFHVRAVSLATGGTLWRAQLRRELGPNGHVRMICDAAGERILVATGSTRYDLFSVRALSLVDAESGSVHPIDIQPDDWRDVHLIRATDRDAFIRVKFSAVRAGLGESPDISLASVDQFGASGQLTNLWGRRAGSVDKSRSRQASAALSIGRTTLLLAPGYGSDAKDPASFAIQEERRRLVNGMIR